jgi:glucokinase
MPLLGIDIGATQIKAGLVSEVRVVRSARIASPGNLEDFRAGLQALMAALEPGTLEGIGVGCKGIIGADTRVERLPGTLHFLEGHRLVDLLPAAPRVVADNDARVALAGEVAFGTARGLRNVLMLTLGSGVGGGLLVDGQMVRGAGGIGGHLGHYTVDPQGPVCICGNRGCLETYFSAHALEGAVAAAVRRGALPRQLSAEELFHSTEPAAQWIVESAERQLAGALAGLVFVVDPELIVLGGQMAGAPGLLDRMAGAVAQRTEGYLRRRVPVRRAEILDGVLGAAALVM